MMRLNVHTEELIRHLGTIAGNLEPSNKAMAQAFHRIGMRLEREVKLAIRARGLVDTGALINSVGYEPEPDGLRVFTRGVRYARVHEFGTKGKGGLLPDIKPTGGRRFLTIPVEDKYKRMRAGDNWGRFDFVKTKQGRFFLMDSQTGKPAYWLVRRSSIPARPYFHPTIRANLPYVLDTLRAAMSEGD